MKSIFDISRIKNNDQLKAEKTDVLNRIKDCLQDITKGNEARGLNKNGSLTVEIKLSILEEYLWNIVKTKYPDFGNN